LKIQKVPSSITHQRIEIELISDLEWPLLIIIALKSRYYKDFYNCNLRGNLVSLSVNNTIWGTSENAKFHVCQIHCFPKCVCQKLSDFFDFKVILPNFANFFILASVLFGVAMLCIPGKEGGKQVLKV
jgi:hypothetical protein